MKNTYETPLNSRYASDEMKYIFSPDKKFKTWRRLWIALAKAENTVGFLFDGVEKSDLFAYVTENGTLPRKTFSMGEAKSKRYYLEARRIII